MSWYSHINDGSRGSANYFFGGRNARSEYCCERCASAYRVLDLSHGASKEEVKQKKWAFAELFSADRLRTMSEQARQLAEAQHKSINAACDQILRCPDCARSRDDLKGSESHPAPVQAAGGKSAEEESQPQPEAGNFVDSVAPEWHPAPEQSVSATMKVGAHRATSRCKFSARMVFLVMVLVAGALAGWKLYSRYEAQMEAERQHLYVEQQHQQKEQQLERAREEQLRQKEEACAEKSAARRQNIANEGANQFPRILH